MNKFIFSFILLATFFISCGKDSGTDDPNNPNGNGGEQPTLTLSLTELTFKSAGEEKTFTITSNSNWTITNPSTWCKIDPTQGNSNTTITAIADPSEEYDDRNFNLTIKAGEITKVVTVTQKKKDAIILTKEKYDIPTEGDNIVVEIKSNITYSAIIPEEHKEWIKQVETNQLGRGLETKNLNFEISANPSTDKREGIIVIKDNSSSLADTIHVYQAQKDELILTQDTYYVSSEGENINVELRSNVDYEVIIPEDVKDWVTQITGRSSRVDNLIFNIAANPTYDNRSAKVIIKDKNSKLADTLNINQTQVNAIILTQEKYEIPSKGQNIKVEVKSNIKYDIIIPDNAREWIKQIQSRALITNIINLSISENTSYEQRAAEIVVKDKNSNLSDTIRITQKQNNTIILTQKKYDIPAEGQQISIEIKSNIEYDILLSPDAEKWVEKIDLSRALATNTLNYNILPNTTYNERKAEIIIKDKGSDLSDTVKIVQDPINTIIIEKKEYNISHKGGIVKVGIKSNTGYNIIIPSSAKTWITQITSKNLITDSLTFNISENSTYEKRKAEIIIRKDELADTITICQEQNDAIILDSKIYNIPMEGKQISIKIQSNINFEVIIAKESQSWIEQIELSKSLSPTTLNFNIKQNPNYTERKGEIFIKDKNSNLSDTIKIIQAPKSDVFIGDITFYSEQDLIDFQKKGYKKVKGDILIYTDNNVNTLQKLENLLVEIEGNLIIDCKLTNLDGLYGLKKITQNLILKRSNIVSFEGLNNLETIGENFEINTSSESSLNTLTSFEGLNKLNYIGGNFEINASTIRSLNALSSFKGLEHLEKINGDFKVIASATSSLETLISFEGLSQLNYIGGDFEINASASLEALTSFKGLENLEQINGNFKIKTSSYSSLDALISFEGLSKLKYIGKDFEINASTKASSLSSLRSFKGLECLEKINGNFKVITSAKSPSSNAAAFSLNSLSSFEGLNKLIYIGGDFEINAYSSGDFSGSSSSLNALSSFKGLECLEKINGNFKVIASAVSSASSSSLKALTSFEGLNRLNYIGGDFEINASSYPYMTSSSSPSSLNALASFKGLENLEKINKNFKVIASASFSLESLTSFEGLNKLNYIGGGFEVISYDLKNLSLNNLITIGGETTINTTILETLTLDKLNSINGDLYIKHGKMTSLDCFFSLTTITGNLNLQNCTELNNIDCLINLSAVKNISITDCPKLYDFCVLKSIVQNNNSDFYTYGNGYNPTKYQLLNGECSKLPEE